jgi:hypothetical protein
MIISTYEKDNRKAEIHKDETDFYVKLIENDAIVDIIKLENKSIHYAESCAENYVERIGTFYQ